MHGLGARATSSAIAAMMLLSSVLCTCSAASGRASAGSGDAHACCPHRRGSDGDRQRGTPRPHHHDANCQCRPTALVESAFAKTLVPDRSWCAIIDGAVHHELLIRPAAARWHDLLDRPPPSFPATLLSLGCALNT